MTHVEAPSEREQRIEAAVSAMACPSWRHDPARRAELAAALDAADKTVPMVPLADSPSGFSAGYLRQRERAERAEAAARDFAKTLDDISGLLSVAEAVYAPDWARNALARHPSFSGEEGKENK